MSYVQHHTHGEEAHGTEGQTDTCMVVHNDRVVIQSDTTICVKNMELSGMGDDSYDVNPASI